MENDWLYRLALSRVRGIGAFHMRALISHFGEARDIFRAIPGSLEKIRGIGSTRGRAIAEFADFSAAEKELAFLEKYKIRPLLFTHHDYPRRLADDRNAPAVIFYKGAADLNSVKIIAVVGTRSPTEYGKRAAENFIRELAFPGLLVVSGLAYGIDAASHRAALKNCLPTVGVLGHGLDQIYPPQHAGLAREIIKQGGLLTQFNLGAPPDDHNFPIRNQVVAGMSDAVIVVETACHGGSMLTAQNALDRNKKLFAFSGRITDSKSEGCNTLIREGKARLLMSPQQFIQEMGWEQPPLAKPDSPSQAALFQTPGEEQLFPDNEKKILHSLRNKGSLSLDELTNMNDLSAGAVAIALLSLELKGLVNSLPGKMYRLGS